MKRLGLIIFILLAINMSMLTAEKYKFVPSMYKNGNILSEHGYFSDSYAHLDFVNDTLIVISAGDYVRSWMLTENIVYDSKTNLENHFLYNIKTREYKWLLLNDFIAPSSGQWTKPVNYSYSPDCNRIIYESAIEGLNYCSVHNLIDNNVIRYKYPDRFGAESFYWNPKKDLILISGWRDTSNTNRTIDRIGPVYYLFNPGTSEFKQIYSGERQYFNLYPFFGHVFWTNDGESLFFEYFHDFYMQGEYDSAKYYDVYWENKNSEEVAQFLFKYDLSEENIKVLYAGKNDNIFLNSDGFATDTSLFCWMDDGIGYIDTKTLKIKKIWSFNQRTRLGEFHDLTISHNGKLLAYYTDSEFVLENISNGKSEEIFSHPISLHGFNTNINFSGDDRFICFGTEFIPKDDPADCIHYGEFHFIVGEIVSNDINH